VNIREVLNGVMYILSTGCQWRALPKDLSPRSTVHDYLERWRSDGQPDGRQSVKSGEKGGPRSTRTAMKRARRSRAKNVMSWSIPRASCCTPS
jgi:transposase